MSFDQLLTKLADRQITLTLEGGRLMYRAPTGVLTPDLREAISQHRQTIIARLTTLQNGKTNGTPTCIHVFPGNWIDHLPRNGRIRTACRLCGRFIGYRQQDS